MTHSSVASVPRLPFVSRPRPRPILALSVLDSDITKLVSLQNQAERLDLQARQLRGSIREGMSSAGLATYQTPHGLRASLFRSSRLIVDRAKLKAILSPARFAAALKPVTSTVLRVK